MQTLYHFLLYYSIKIVILFNMLGWLAIGFSILMVLAALIDLYLAYRNKGENKCIKK